MLPKVAGRGSIISPCSFAPGHQQLLRPIRMVLPQAALSDVMLHCRRVIVPPWCSTLLARICAAAQSRAYRPGIDSARLFYSQCPHESRWRSQLLGQPRSLAQLPVALNRDPVRGALLILLHLGLRPQVRSLGGGRRGARHQSRANKNRKREKGEGGERAINGSGKVIHSSVESTRV